MKKRSMLKVLSAFMALNLVMSSFSPAIVSAAEPEEVFEAGDAAELTEETDAVFTDEEITGAGTISWRDRVNVDGFPAYAGYEEGAYAEWLPVSGAKQYNAYLVDSSSNETKLDDSLIREYKIDGQEYWRVDAVGVKPGTYRIRIEETNTGASVTTPDLTVVAHDRSGFAFTGAKTPGAYKADGTLKEGAKVIYVDNSNFDTVTLTVNNKNGTITFTGVQEIVNESGYTKYATYNDNAPLDIRIIGLVDTTGFPSGSWGSGSEGLQIKGTSKNETAITIEGIGEDATIMGFGILCRDTKYTEIRNLGLLNFKDDGVSLDTDNLYTWVHNVDFFYGGPGGDSDQAKGDGSLDVKEDSKYQTYSYNHFWDSGKCSLCGMKSESGPNYITYHHNWFDHSDSRHPRIRTMSVHVYNNYYDGVAKYGVGVTTGADAFVESNFFRNANYVMMSSLQGSDCYAGGTTYDAGNNGTFSKETGGSIKAYNNRFAGVNTIIPYGCTQYTLKGVTVDYDLPGKDGGDSDSRVQFDCYVATTRDEQVPAEVKSFVGEDTYSNFDTTQNLGVTEADITPVEEVPAVVMAKAGRINGGDLWFNFDNTVDDASYAINSDLKAKVTGYKTSLVHIGGNVEGGTNVDASLQDLTKITEERVERTETDNTDGVIYSEGEGGSGATGGGSGTSYVDDYFKADEFIANIMSKTGWTTDQSGVNISTFANFSEDWLTINGANGTVFRLSDATTCKSAPDKVGLAKGIGYMEVTAKEDGILKVSCCSDGKSKTSTMQVTDSLGAPVADTAGNTTHSLTGSEAVTLSFEVTAGTYRIGYVTDDNTQNSIRLTMVKYSVPKEDDSIPVEVVIIDPSEDFELEVGKEKTITATVSPNNATDKNVTWRSSDTKVATVFKGVVKAVAEGTAVITAASGKKSATVKVTVKAASQGGDPTDPDPKDPTDPDPKDPTDPDPKDPTDPDPKDPTDPDPANPVNPVNPTVSMAQIPLYLGDKTYTISFNKAIQYTGGKVEIPDIKINGAKIGETIPGTQVTFAKVKYKNNKEVGTGASAIIVLKANKGADKNVKNMVKFATIQLKANPITFDIIPRTLTADKVSGTAQYSAKKGKWKFKLTVDVGGKKPLKLKYNKNAAKTDFTPDASFAPAADGTYPSMVSITGTNNFKGSVSVNVIVK